jgi:adenylate cyclase
LERKLTAILCADVYGYSRLMGHDEEATLRTLTSHRKIVDSLIENHHGRFVNSAGDSVLAEFASVVEAVNCALDIQSGLEAENANSPPQRRMEFRIGVNLGDVMVEGAQIYGDGVNVAARLEGLAYPGGICISDTAHAQAKNKLALGYEDLGAQFVKNIAEPVHVWRVLTDGAAPDRLRAGSLSRKYWRGGVLSLAGLAIIVVTFVLVQHLAAKTASNVRFDSAAREAGTSFARYSVDRGTAVLQPEWRPEAGLLQRRNQRSAHQWSLADSRPLCHRTQFQLRLQG